MTREDVIKGLECCLGDIISDIPNLCINCPYAEGGYATQNCSRLLREDAIILLKQCIKCSEKTIAVISDLQGRLKAQEPRVMTLEEVEEWLGQNESETNPIWVEFIQHRGTNGWRKWHFTSDMLTWCKNGECRCWTSRPTDAQMKAVKWDE